jgi:hypothetical protein
LSPVNSTFFINRDTLNVTPPDSGTVSRKFTQEEATDLFKALERKERTMDSLARVRAYRKSLRSTTPGQGKGFDTSAVPYFIQKDSFREDPNTIFGLGETYYSPKDTMKPVLFETAAREKTAFIREVSRKEVMERDQSHDLRPDWLMMIIIGCLVLLAWLKLFYNKFLDQTVQSLLNYQLSTKLLRDQNIFSRRVAFALNVNFILAGAAFMYLVVGFFNVRFFNLADFQSFLLYSGILGGLIILRYFALHAVGRIFNHPNEFREYLHQLFLIHKSLGIFFLAMVIGIAYIREDFRIYLVYLSLIVTLLAYLMRFAKGLKLILNKKDVLIFYLILYLCTLEFLPLLIVYRFFSLSVQAGSV